MHVYSFLIPFFWICVISNTEKYMPEQFMKQKSVMGLNLICRNWSSIIGIQQVATTLCKKNPAYRRHWLSGPMRIEPPLTKENLFLGCPKKMGEGMRMGSENNNFHFLFWRGDAWGVLWGLLRGVCHILPFSAVQCSSALQ